MKAAGLLQTSIFLSIATTFLTGCGGFKILTLTNKTGKPLTYKTRPELPALRRYTVGDTIPVLAESKVYTLEPDSTAILSICFRWLVKSKINEEDLTFDYLNLQTAKDTIIATNRAEIIQLIQNPITKYRKKLDKKYV